LLACRAAKIAVEIGLNSNSTKSAAIVAV
jgi:hypothetical protein